MYWTNVRYVLVSKLSTRSRKIDRLHINNTNNAENVHKVQHGHSTVNVLPWQLQDLGRHNIIS